MITHSHQESADLNIQAVGLQVRKCAYSTLSFFKV